MSNPSSPAVTADNVVRNGSFDEPADADLDAPAEWSLTLGGPSDVWAIDTEIVNDSTGSLRFEPKTHCVAYQMLEPPTTDLTGKAATVSVDIRKEGQITAVVQLLALNPELPPHPVLQTGAAGFAQVMAAGGPEGQFRRYRAKCIGTGELATLQLVLSASGSGKVWFDNVVVAIAEPTA